MSNAATFMPAASLEIAPGALAVAGGFLFLEHTRSLVAADIHLGYEELIGGALPLWSTRETLMRLTEAVLGSGATEVILLGDILHGSRMSAGAAREIMAALEDLRTYCTVTIIAGNHEGRSRGAAVLGDTHEILERADWLLLHGDQILRRKKRIIGHLHPSLPLGQVSAPAFLASPTLLVLPALTPYSNGLNVCSGQARAALKPWLPSFEELNVYAVAGKLIYPFGLLEQLVPLARRSDAPRMRKRFR